MKLRWSLAAQADVDRHWLFHAERSLEYADEVETRLIGQAESLMRHSRKGRPLRGGALRELSIPDIQYVIVYRASDEEIMIVRIWSTAEDR